MKDNNILFLHNLLHKDIDFYLDVFNYENKIKVENVLITDDSRKLYIYDEEDNKSVYKQIKDNSTILVMDKTNRETAKTIKGYRIKEVKEFFHPYKYCLYKEVILFL